MTGATDESAVQSIAFHTQRQADTVHSFNHVQPRPVDPRIAKPDYRLVEQFGTLLCLKHAVLPWRRIAGVTIVLCTDLDLSPQVRAQLQTCFGPIRLGICAGQALHRALLQMSGPELAHEAETRVPAVDSCRSWGRNGGSVAVPVVGLTLLVLALLHPGIALLVLTLWAVTALITNTGLKVAAALADIWRPRRVETLGAAPILARLPVISLLVPLYHEKEVASHIVRRLDRLEYPRDNLDVCLIVEDNDALTRRALEQTALPAWARVVEVPQGTIRTKPRALNFAMTQARGSIIGIYDAEDAPEPRQLHKVVQRFAERPPEVACLQGKLDYYNPNSNWISRCFTLEYATWFRLILPGLERLGLVIPLGGTTLFLRRGAIEKLGGWDAHNVTEDADLGVRLARAGFRTEVIDTVTMEEANARAWPWVRQRSRWLKGYAMTWAVHMRNPVRLWHDLGAWRFFGVQMLFLGTLSGFVLAPLLWSFWLILLGLPHPLNGMVDPTLLHAAGLTFLGAEVLSLCVTALAARRAGRARLALWAPLLQVYFPLATIAAYKGLAEMLYRPFFWDKTTHGVHAPIAVTVPPAPSAHPVAAE